MDETVMEKFEAAVSVAKGKVTPRLEPNEMLHATQAILNISISQSQYREPSDIDDVLVTVLERVRPNLSPSDMRAATQSVRNLVEVTGKGKPTRTKGTGT